MNGIHLLYHALPYTQSKKCPSPNAFADTKKFTRSCKN